MLKAIKIRIYPSAEQIGFINRPWLQRCVEHIGGGRKDNRAEFARIDACGLPNYGWQGGVSAPKK